MLNRTQRIRDPIHGLIVFDEKNETDMVAWQLIETPEFQRLRRIKQFGVTDFVFPGATHTRFSHSIGVYHNARKLMEIILTCVGENDFDPERARIALLAALLHDVGHGPLSHAFEGAREAIAFQRGEKIQKHEIFSAQLIEAVDGNLRPILDDRDSNLASEIARLLKANDPLDFYHAVVSSSFDADRLDYLMRDRYMTGSHAGAIDTDWLLNNLTTYTILERQEDDDEPIKIPTFVFKAKARHAAEDFLLARFRMYMQVYMHKTTRGFEKLITGLFQYIGSDTTDKKALGISDSHPLMQFLAPGGEKLQLYRRLDDIVVWAVIEQLTQCDDKYAADLAKRLWNRENLCALDVSSRFENDQDAQTNAIRRIDRYDGDNPKLTIFKDDVKVNLYSEKNGEVAKAHKMVRVLNGSGSQADIVTFEDTIISKKLQKGVGLTRYYFLSADEKEAAEKVMRGG